MSDDAPHTPSLGFKCLLCARRIEAGEFDPCVLTLTARADRPRREQMEQTFYVHMACLQANSEVRNVFYIAQPGYSTVGECEDERANEEDADTGAA